MKKRNNVAGIYLVVGFAFVFVSVIAGEYDETNLVSSLSVVGSVVSFLIALVFADFDKKEKKNED